MEIIVMEYSKETFDKMINLIKSIEDNQLLCWYRDLAYGINKAILSLKTNYVEIYKLLVAYRSSINYYEKMLESVEDADVRKDLVYKCAVTFFFISCQAGIISMDSNFVKTEAFNAVIDYEDFKNMSPLDLDKFDYRQAIQWIRLETGVATNEEVASTTIDVWGMYTALLLK